MKSIRNTFSSFSKLESLSSIVLFLSAILAIVFANTSLNDIYLKLLDSYLGFSVGDFSISKPLILWINDGLMAIFFFVIGLEIKREFIAGELKSWKKSALPVFAAIGGMIFPVLVFVIIHPTEEGMKGWGIPMATDIAFSLGILTLLGKRIPLNLKIFLTAFAIIDDIGAVIVIAVFYSAEIYWSYLIIALIIYSVLVIFSVFQVKAKYFYLLAGIIIWFLFLKSGIHPTIAGIMMAFVIPINRKIGKLKFAKELKLLSKEFKKAKTKSVFLTDEQLEVIVQTEGLVEKVQPYLQHLEHKLHIWVAFLIMPVFAFANSGVSFNNLQDPGINPIAFHIGLAMLIGKVTGIFTFSYLSVKMKIAELPDSINFKMIFGVSFLGAVGFTMALFINALAFDDIALVNSAKFGIIISSLIAGIIGYIILVSVTSKKEPKNESILD